MSILDLSQYDLPLDPVCLKAAGVTGAILGVYHPTGQQPMLSAARYLRAEGIEVLGFYGLPYFGSPYGENRDIDWAISNAKQLGVKKVWIDAEIDAAPFGFSDDVGATPASRIRVIRALVAKIRAAGLEPGIYSAPWWWKPEVGDTTEFKDLPLWFANYGRNDATQTPLTTLPEPFGGWVRPAVHQYTSVLQVCGQGRDANYVFEADMTPQQLQAEFHKNMAAFFPAYIEAYYNRGFTVRNGRLDPGETSDPGPLIHDVPENVAGMTKEEAIKAFEAALTAFRNALGNA